MELDVGMESVEVGLAVDMVRGRRKNNVNVKKKVGRNKY